MKNLKWNEEYFISFVLDGKKFSTPVGKGFMCKFDADDEKNRLINKGCKSVKVSIRKWN